MLPAQLRLDYSEREAQGRGLVPKLVYDLAVNARPSHWPPAPSFDEVMSWRTAREDQG